VADPADAPREPGTREHVIPTGEMHLVIRLSEAPVRLFADVDDREGRTFGQAVVAGPRSAFHIKDVSSAGYAVGVQLHPAASLSLFGVLAEELAGRHVALADLWPGAAASGLREQLLQVPDPARQLDVLEEALARRLPRVQAMHPAVATALEHFRATPNVGMVVKETGYSHRALLTQFRRTMGLTPKRYLRVMRMRRAVRRIGSVPSSDLAAEMGFSDQAHFVREFREFTGVTPTYYLRARPLAAHHVRILQDRGGANP